MRVTAATTDGKPPAQRSYRSEKRPQKALKHAFLERNHAEISGDVHKRLGVVGGKTPTRQGGLNFKRVRVKRSMDASFEIHKYPGIPQLRAAMSRRATNLVRREP